MAAIRLDLSQFKASGIYTLEYDQSENILVFPQTIRLVVGFSKKGPFNTPVFCDGIKTARTIFGDIDKALERKGSFFHRSLFTCLQTGPVFALNLLALNDDTVTSPDDSDQVNYRSFSMDAAGVGSTANGILRSKLYSSFYNKERFWFPDPEYFLATRAVADQGKLLNFVNLGKTPISVFVKKSAVKGYDLTAKEWYHQAKLEKPSFLDDNDYINDFFVDVVAVEGDWTDFAALSLDPVYSAYFNARGLKQNKSDDFLSLPEVNMSLKLTGCLIPDFKDQNGVNQFIETLVNNTTGITGLFCAINKTAFDDITSNTDQIDLVGHHLIDALAQASITNIDFLSYNAPLVNDYTYVQVSPSYVDTSGTYDVLVASEGTAIYTDWKVGVITDGDYIIKDNVGTKQYLRFFANVDNVGNPYVQVEAYDSVDFSSQEDVAAFGSTYDSTGSLVASGLNIVSTYGNYNQYFDTITADPMKPIGNNEFVISKTDAALMNIGDLVVDSTGARLTRITKKSTYATNQVKITATSAVKFYSSNRVQVFKRIQDFVKEIEFTYLQGFVLKDTHMPNGSDARMNEILDVMYNTNIANTLKNKNIITFRYIVDTFNGGLEPNSKSRLTQLAKLRQKCLAICNTPSIKQFIDSTDPQFTDAPTDANPKPLLNVQYIADGGNQSLNPTVSYSLVDETLGSKFVGYFMPNIILNVDGKNISVPPAAHVSNLFVQKFINGNPFSLVAGPKRGLISDVNLVGVEIDLSDEDRAILEPFGINPIVRHRGVGTMIYANQTGFQKVNSAFNNLHVRDLLITIENDIESLLAYYMFDFNDAPTRLEIKSKVDSYLEGVQSSGGIYAFSTIMDTSNNTKEIIDQNIGIIDIYIEPVRGIHKFLNRVTVLKTGGASSGGFTVA